MRGAPSSNTDHGHRRAAHPAEYRPISRRRRLLIVALAVATAVAVITTLLDPPGGVQRPRTAPAAALSPAVTAVPAPCAPGQENACVGGKAEVLQPPPPTARP